MDGNKDEAERCIEMAEGFLNAGNHEKAEKFLLKAERLYSTKKAKGNFSPCSDHCSQLFFKMFYCGIR